MASRMEMSIKNAFWSYFSMMITVFLQFISRTVFIYQLGENYLGLNGLFSNILGVLSFAELGIGTAINFSLYKPVAQQDVEKIKAYMYFYKWAYRVIALIVFILGMVLFPFLNYLVTDPGNVGDIRVYYLIYLFNTVTSYLVSYKFSIANAEQKNYIYTNINLITTVVTTLFQIISLVLWKNFLLYLLAAAIVGLLQKIFICVYFNRKYPYLKESNVIKLNENETAVLKRKVSALIVHKIGDVSVHQTDNIIISACISTVMVGLISNYTLIINTISTCINVVFNSVIGSLGNLSATTSKERQYSVFKEYRFLGFWLFGFTSIALSILLTPFIQLWIGKKMIVDDLIINLILIDFYMIGQRICLNNFKSAAGVFEEDKYVALLQAIVNLVVSIMLAKIIGVPGVYIGTLVQGTMCTILKPILTFNTLFEKKWILYFGDSIKYIGVLSIAYAMCMVAKKIVLVQITITNFAILVMIIAILPNVIFYIVFHKSKEFVYFKTYLWRCIKR